MVWLLTLLLAGDPDALAYGGGACGKLTGGVALPCSGPNFEATTRSMCLALRNHLHPLAAATVVDAYALLRARHPERTWQYGETGWKHGGKFVPHHTHQNGLSADFFVPVLDNAGRPGTLFIAPWNLFGYRLDFDDEGTMGPQRIDFPALADHLLALEEAGRSHGVRPRLIILHLPLQARLFSSAPLVRPLKARFNTRAAWVQHDEHYHVDFDIPARLKRPWKCR